MPRFVYDLVVALTNNPAERVLCVMKLFIKISSRFRSEHGARDSATIRNALLTVCKQGSNGIEALRRDPTSLSAGLQSQPAIRPRDSCLPLRIVPPPLCAQLPVRVRVVKIWAAMVGMLP